MRKSDSNKTGAYGEKFTAEYLIKSGYTIKQTNYCSKYGEIDIIAEKDGVLCFVEVKTRSLNCAFEPVYAVNESKRKKIIKTAYQYIFDFQYDGAARFDVALLILDNEKTVDFTYIENAFGVA